MPILAIEECWEGTNHPKTDVVVPVIARIVVTIRRTAIPRIVVPRAAAFLFAYPNPLFASDFDSKAKNINCKLSKFSTSLSTNFYEFIGHQAQLPRNNPVMNYAETMQELPIIQKTYDLVKWYVPIITRLPRDYRFTLGARMNQTLYDLLEGFLRAKFTPEKITLLEQLSSELDILQYQTRLLLDFELISVRRYEFAGGMITDISNDLGGWLKQQRCKQSKSSRQ